MAENFQDMPKPFRRYATGSVWRNEKPGPGRFRQFTQFDADTVGAESVAADAEMCMLAADTLEALGIERGQYVIKVNNRKLLDGVMEVAGLGGEENALRRADGASRHRQAGPPWCAGCPRASRHKDARMKAAISLPALDLQTNRLNFLKSSYSHVADRSHGVFAQQQ